MQTRQAKVAQEYAGRQVQVGDKFDVDEQDVVVLLTTGLITAETTDATPGYMTRSMADAAGVPYTHRAMIAKGSKRRTETKAA